MATLKSFELKGNKQSFANFISNLSPCDSPFTSMIGKEVIDETQYSWQTDSLAPATYIELPLVPPAFSGFMEGSATEFQTRATTQVFTNFTSILRTVASVSDTAKELGLNGRKKELSYQMGKAGKEILRDLEHMTLHNLNGHLGTKNRASSFAGFEGLVAGMDVADPDCGAVVHKEVEVAGINFDKDDLFDLTMNLYLAGSKADKIMFHPRFITAFSDLTSNDLEAENTYRMFDNLGTTYNAQVKTIKDPLGKIFTLIPNRYMPENKFYIFHESDWTQTVLRAPGATKLAKNGSSEQYMIEMEVGLRHRHPYASGILAFREVTIANDFVPTKKTFTASLQEQQDVKAAITVDWVAEKDLDVHFHTTDEDIVRFEQRVVKTDSSGFANNRMQIGEKTGVAEVWTICKGVKSVVTRIGVAAPKVVLTIDDLYPVVGQKITLTAAIEKADGTPTGAGHKIDWYVSHSSYLELDSIHSITNEAGFAQTTAKVRNIDEMFVQAIFGINYSDTEILNYIPQVGGLELFSVTPNTVPIDGFSNLSVKVIDEAGDPMVNETVVWITSDPNTGRPVAIGSPTDADGIAVQALKGISRGTATIHAEVAGIESEKVIFFVGHNAQFDLEILPNPCNFGEEVVFHGNVKGQDGHAIQDLQFVIRSEPAEMRLNMDTDEEGDYTDTHTFLSNSDYEIIVELPSLGISRTEVLKIKDILGVGELRPAEVLTQPLPIGGKSTAKVVLTDAAGMPLKDTPVYWTVSPSHVVTANTNVTRTDQNGMSVIELTGISKGFGEVSYSCKNEHSEKAHFLVGQGVEVVVTHNPEKPLMNQNVTYTVAVKHAGNGAGIARTEVEMNCSPSVGNFPDHVLVTNAQGIAEFTAPFAEQGNFTITAVAPSFGESGTTLVEVQPPNSSNDLPHVHTITGHNITPHSHSTGVGLPITLKSTLHGSPSLGMRMDCISLDPSIGYCTVPDVPTNSSGEITFQVFGAAPGVARFRAKARGAIANYVDFEVTIDSPKLNVTIVPSTVQGGKRIEFSADLKDARDKWVPGAQIRWEAPHNMLGRGEKLDTQTTDQFGRVYYDRIAALWGTHTVRAVLVGNDLVSSRDHTVTIHM